MVDSHHCTTETMKKQRSTTGLYTDYCTQCGCVRTENQKKHGSLQLNLERWQISSEQRLHCGPIPVKNAKSNASFAHLSVNQETWYTSYPLLYITLYIASISGNKLDLPSWFLSFLGSGLHVTRNVQQGNSFSTHATTTGNSDVSQSWVTGNFLCNLIAEINCISQNQNVIVFENMRNQDVCSPGH